MLDNLSSQQSVFYEDRGQGFDVAYLIGLLKRRAFYFIIPFLVVAMLGLAVTENQKPIYRAEGKILAESSGISTDLLRPMISEVLYERFEIFKERIMAPDNLIAMVDKFSLFPGIRDRMSGSQLIELMRHRVAIKPVPLEMQPSNPTTAFSVSFDYEVPELALKVDNEFLHEILTEDASRRTNSAVQTAQILQEQVETLKSEYDAVVAQLEIIKQRPPDQQEASSEEVKAQMNTLATLQAELAQKSSVYADEHPVIKSLKRDIAALKHTITTPRQPTSANKMVDQSASVTQVLLQQETLIAKNLEEAKNRLATARIGETLERGLQAQHLQVIQYPELPGGPIRPKKLQWLAISLALAGMIGAASLVAAEVLDQSIRSRKQLAKIIDPHLIVAIPYLAKPGEQRRRRVKFILLCLALMAITGATTAAIIAMKRNSVDFSQLSYDEATKINPFGPDLWKR